MCGIVGIFNIAEQSDALRQKALRMSKKIRQFPGIAFWYLCLCPLRRGAR